MKEVFKNILSVQTDDTKYKRTIIFYFVAIVCISIVIIISNFIPIVMLSRFIMVCLVTFCFYLTIAFFSKLIFISENIEKQRVKNNEYKFKYKSILVNVDDLIRWIYDYSSPEQIIINSNGKYHYVEISYDTKGRRGKYINRKIYLDDVEMKVDDIVSFLKTSSVDDKIEVFETFDHQSPCLLVDEIEKL